MNTKKDLKNLDRVLALVGSIVVLIVISSIRRDGVKADVGCYYWSRWSVVLRWDLGNNLGLL
jgi:uncharacterized membrane-anchored protein